MPDDSLPGSPEQGSGLGFLCEGSSVVVAPLFSPSFAQWPDWVAAKEFK